MLNGFHLTGFRDFIKSKAGKYNLEITTDGSFIHRLQQKRAKKEVYYRSSDNEQDSRYQP